MDKLTLISQVVKSYFNNNPSVVIIPVKDLMPQFIVAGIFAKDEKNGLPIRRVLRNLDQTNQLHLIPYVIAERKAVNTYWFFDRNASNNSSTLPKQSTPKSATSTRTESDENYILDLCDEVLNKKGIRQYRFDFLRGDTGVKLPIDIYYPELNLVIEYREYQHDNPVKHFDKPDILTVSGVHRGEQRKSYDQRRRDVLPQNGIQLIEFSFTDFQFYNRHRIVRSKERDLNLVKTRISIF